MKNGGLIRGIIVEQVPNQSIKIQTRDGNIFVYKIDEVEKITKELGVIKDTYRGEYNTFQSKEYNLAGYRGSVDIGYVFGLYSRDFYGGQSKENRLELTTTHGYQVINEFFIGVGAGFNYFTAGNVLMLPAFLNIKGYLLPSTVSPYFDIKGGYTTILSQLEDEDLMGGLYFSPAIGVRYLDSDKIGLTASVGFTFQQISDRLLVETMNINGISLKFGVEF